MRALVVEDNSVDRKIVAECLRACGFDTIVEASDGTMGLSAVEKEPAFDLVFVDWMMPETNGLEVVKAIRMKSSKDELPIVMITSTSDRTRVQSAVVAGINDFIVKPLKAVVVQEKIRRIKHAQELARQSHAASSEKEPS